VGRAHCRRRSFGGSFDCPFLMHLYMCNQAVSAGPFEGETTTAADYCLRPLPVRPVAAAADLKGSHPHPPLPFDGCVYRGQALMRIHNALPLNVSASALPFYCLCSQTTYALSFAGGGGDGRPTTVPRRSDHSILLPTAGPFQGESAYTMDYVRVRIYRTIDYLPNLSIYLCAGAHLHPLS
jgi:hypothetical protein